MTCTCAAAYGGRALAQVVDVQGDTPNLADRSHGAADLIDGVDEGFDEAVLRGGGSLLRG